MPFNRTVTFILGPAITLAAGYISLWLSRHFPGAHLPNAKSIAGVITSGLVTILPMILTHLKIHKWLDGWQKWEHDLNTATHGALDESVQRFLESVAKKTGVALPSGVTPDSLVGTVNPTMTPEAGMGAGEPPPVAQPGAFTGENAPRV